MRAFLLFVCALLVVSGQAQENIPAVPNSQHGWQLSPRGTIRILVLFAEVEYDVEPARDPQPEGSKHWPKGQLPTWADDMFDPHALPVAKGRISRYYQEMSLGNFSVLGDHVDGMLTLRESEYADLRNASRISSSAVEEANKLGELRTKHRLTIADLDLWKDGGKAGLPKVMGPDDPHMYDHVMVILRNSVLTHGQGSTDGGSPGKLFGYESDTQSRFGGMNAMPFEILQHEFNHMLFGGNNFHSGGGNAPQFSRYFIPMQGGWGMMGGANSALLTANAWDRDRLGWMPEGAEHRIRAHDLTGTEVNSDLDPLAGDTGIFVLGDMVTTGDALRIRMPFLQDDEFPQWIWFENHQTRARNGSASDVFHYEEGNACIEGAVPGIYAYHQVDRGEREGKEIYGGHADFLRPLVASGHSDLFVHGEMEHQCTSYGKSTALARDPKLDNALTGVHDLELPRFDRDNDGKLGAKELEMLNVEVRNGVMHDHAYFFGNARQAFTLHGARRVGMGTNPSTANVMTLVCSERDILKRARPNNRVVYPNGISVEMLEQRMNGDVVVRVRSGDTYFREDIRWCADSIVLNDLNGYQGYSLYLAPGKELLLDRSRTPTRIDAPETIGDRTYFADPTRLVVLSGAKIRLNEKAVLRLRNGSELHLMPGSVLELTAGAKLEPDASSRIVQHGTARVEAPAKVMKKLCKKNRLITQP